MLDRFHVASFPECFRWMAQFLVSNGMSPLALNGAECILCSF